MGRITADQSRIRQLAEQAGEPVTDLILKALKKGAVERDEPPVTLFAACPNSEAVTRASIRAAKKHNAPIKYAATLNQVDNDGGYTRWTQQQFLDLVKDEVDSSGFEGPVIVALDHGGPWLKDKQTIEKWPLERAMQGVKDSLVACIDAGYDLLHIDPTVDRTLAGGEAISINTVAERTVDMIDHAERHRRSANLPRISYEVGTEEVHGGLADMNTFRRFLNGLREGLDKCGLQDVWPCFVVGKVGTDLHTTLFDPDVAVELVKTAAEHGSFIKGHYTDGVENPEAYPESGMGGANVGPEFTEAEYFSLKKLSMSESEFVRQGKLESESGLMQALEDAVVASGRWEKWRQADESGKKFSALAVERREWLVRTGCRYIWTADGVVEARGQLYANLSAMGIDGESQVIDGIVRTMDKYFEKFNLTGTIPRIEKELEEGL